MMRRSLISLCAASLCCLAFTTATVAAAPVASPAPTAAARIAASCVNVITPYIRASAVRTSGPLRCPAARTLVRRYFRKVVNSAQTDGGCAQRRFADGCAVGNYVCKSNTAGTRGRCSDGVRTVRFRESDTGPSA
jgi:hypothetical protein